MPEFRMPEFRTGLTQLSQDSDGALHSAGLLLPSSLSVSVQAPLKKRRPVAGRPIEKNITFFLQQINSLQVTNKFLR